MPCYSDSFHLLLIFFTSYRFGLQFLEDLSFFTNLPTNYIKRVVTLIFCSYLLIMKTCTKCEIEKPFEDFFKRKASKDGYSYKCKECQYKYFRDNKYWKNLKQDNPGIYLVTTTCNETYIGGTVDLKRRKYQHSCKSKRSDSCIAGNYKIKSFKVLENINSTTRERYWIKKLKPSLNQRMNECQKS